MRETAKSLTILLGLGVAAGVYGGAFAGAYLLAVVLLLYGLLCLYRLDRLDEPHHLYWGAVLFLAGAVLHALGFATLGWWAMGLGLAIMLDDTFQHGVQAHDDAEGRPIRPDFTPVHWLGVWIEHRLGVA